MQGRNNKGKSGKYGRTALVIINKILVLCEASRKDIKLNAKIPKEEVVRVMKQLKEMGYSNKELAIKLGKTTQSIWRYQSLVSNGIPCLSDYQVLKALTVISK